MTSTTPPSPRAIEFAALRSGIQQERAALLRHPLYDSFRTLDDVQFFMEHHVFAVLDFMSLLKALQRALTCLDLPWTPRGDATVRRIVNEIVLGEESDEVPGIGAIAHFELYRAAMIEAGARVDVVDAFVARVQAGVALSPALALSKAPPAARRFVERTFATIESGSTPRIVGAFALGREDVIPEMFREIVSRISHRSGRDVGLLVTYLERHVSVDGDSHGPLTARLVESVCGDDPSAWRDAREGARDALHARREFWDSITQAMRRGHDREGEDRGAADRETRLAAES